MNIIFKPECKTEIIEPTYDLPIIGEPISKTGASANNSNAYGVIVGIIGDGSSRRVRVMTEGYIDYDKVKENYMEYTGEAINALTGITLCSDGKLPTGGGLTTDEKTIILTLFKNAAYTADMSATIAQLETLWSGGTVGPDEPAVPDVPDADVSQSGSVLSIVSGVTVNQSGSVLAIA